MRARVLEIVALASGGGACLAASLRDVVTSWWGWPLAAVALAAVVARLRMLPRPRITRLVIAGALLLALKVWLGRAWPTVVLADAATDDALFVRSAKALDGGRWLGAYDSTTLVKGPGFPALLALCRRLHVPPKTAEHVLYGLACAAIVLALAGAQPLRRRPVLLWLVFVALLFNPVTYGAGSHRVIRDPLYVCQTMFLVAGLTGMIAHRRGPLASLVAWAQVAAVALAWAFVTREESVWFLPGAAVAAGVGAMSVADLPDRRRRLAACVAPFVVAWLAVQAVSAVNDARYGAWTVAETRWGPFERAMGALQRVKHAARVRHVPVPTETRERIYAVSPAFDEMRGVMEGPDKHGWIQYNPPGLPDDYGGGHFMWAVRSAAAQNGHHASGASAARFYDRLAGEVNAACDDGRLVAWPRSDSIAPPWQEGDTGAFARSFARGTLMTLQWSGVQEVFRPATGSAEQVARFSEYVRVAPRTEDRPTRLERYQRRATAAVLTIYRVLTWPLVVVAVLWSVVAVVAWTRLGRRGALPGFFAMALALWATRLAVLAVIEATSFPAMRGLYMQPAYALLPVVLLAPSIDLALGEEGLAGALVARVWRAWRHGRSYAPTS